MSWINSTVIMLPSSEKAKIGDLVLCINNCNDLFNEKDNEYIKGKLYIIPRWFYDKSLLINFKKQHLYFLSDEKIKEGDWVYDSEFKVVFQKNKYVAKFDDEFQHKIIATTNTSLTIEIPCPDKIIGCEIGHYIILPQPSKKFIELYVKSYSNSPITNVLIECNYRSNAALGYNEYVYLQPIGDKNYVPIRIDANINQDSYELGRDEEFEDWEIETVININSSNEINIKPIKDSWNTNELKFELNHILNDVLCKCIGKELNQLPDSNKIANFVDKWINKNL